MIAGILHQGSGIGNQLFRYIATRTLALDKGYEFGMVAPELFKGKDFMSLDMGLEIKMPYEIEKSTGKVIPHAFNREAEYDPIVWEEKTSYYNPEFNFIEDNTIIDGEFQSIQYFGHRLNEIDEWLRIEQLYIPENLCVIGFRGGEFYLYPELGLPKSYFEEAIAIMKNINPDMKFEVHTDDPKLAQEFFPDYKVIHDIEINWRSMRYARHAIIANSSFYILPRLLAHQRLNPRGYGAHETITIAPRYWARHNTKEWSRPDNYYSVFKYI